MSAATVRIVVAIFLIAHGWIHWSLTTVPTPQPGGLKTPFWPSLRRADVDNRWPASRLGLSPNVVRIGGWLLLLAATLLFAAAGLGLLGVPVLHALWGTLAISGSVVSLVLLALYWHPWFVAGPVLDLAILAAVIWHTPTALFS